MARDDNAIALLTTESSASLGPENMQLVPVAAIDDSGRLRPVDSVVAEGIAASINQVGLISPIMVCRLPGQSGYRLVAGGHRLAAVKLLSWATIPAMVCSSDALLRRSIEIAENFFRAQMSPLDQARFVSELIDNEKARQGIAPDQDGRANNKRGGKKQVEDDLCIVHKSIGIQAEVADRLGLNQSSVSRHLALNGIAPSFLRRVRALSLAGNAAQLRSLAKLHWTEQDEVLKLIEAGTAKDVGAAQAIRGNHAPADPERRRISTFIDTFARMSRRERLGALSLLSALLPAGVEIAFGDARAEAKQAAATSGEHLRKGKNAADAYTDEDAKLSAEMAALRASGASPVPPTAKTRSPLPVNGAGEDGGAA